MPEPIAYRVSKQASHISHDKEEGLTIVIRTRRVVGEVQDVRDTRVVVARHHVHAVRVARALDRRDDIRDVRRRWDTAR